MRNYPFIFVPGIKYFRKTMWLQNGKTGKKTELIKSVTQVNKKDRKKCHILFIYLSIQPNVGEFVFIHFLIAKTYDLLIN